MVGVLESNYIFYMVGVLMETKDSVVEMEDTNEAKVVAVSRWKLQNSAVLNPLIR